MKTPKRQVLDDDVTAQRLRYGLSSTLLSPSSNLLVLRIREVLVAEIGSGGTNATQIARSLGVSKRTLARRLEQENTSFRALLDETRRDLALHDLTATTRPIRDIAKRLGFASSQSFHRAFKRWMGTTVMRFRTAATPKLHAP